MGLIGLIIFALVIWLLWRLIKNYQRSLQSRKNRKTTRENRLASDNIVACEQCRVHVPEKDALRFTRDNEDLWFCSEAHKDKFLALRQ